MTLASSLHYAKRAKLLYAAHGEDIASWYTELKEEAKAGAAAAADDDEEDDDDDDVSPAVFERIRAGTRLELAAAAALSVDERVDKRRYVLRDRPNVMWWDVM